MARQAELPKASCRLRQRNGNCQKFAADCGKEMATAKRSLQIATKNWQLPKGCCKLRQGNGNCQKLPANCGKEMTAAKRFLQIAAKKWQLPKGRCRLQQGIGSFWSAHWISGSSPLLWTFSRVNCQIILMFRF
jgi:hypothetical protein